MPNVAFLSCILSTPTIRKWLHRYLYFVGSATPSFVCYLKFYKVSIPLHLEQFPWSEDITTFRHVQKKICDSGTISKLRTSKIMF